MVWVSMMALNSLLSGSGEFGCDHLDRLEQGKAGLDAAHDDVDGVGQRPQELLLAALLEKAQDPARQAEAGAEGHHGAAQQAAADEEGEHEPYRCHNTGHDPEFLGRPGPQSGLGQADGEGDGFLLLAAGVEFLQRSLDLLAARTLAFLDLARRRVGTCDRGAARLGLPLARQRGIDEYPCQAADGGGGEKRQCKRLHAHRPPTSCRRLRRRRAQPPAASLRCSTVHVPRSADVRCRSSGAAR